MKNNIEIRDIRENKKDTQRVIRIELTSNNKDAVDVLVDTLMESIKIVLEQRQYPSEIKKVDVITY